LSIGKLAMTKKKTITSTVLSTLKKKDTKIANPEEDENVIKIMQE
jgi:hypothetical protein